MGTPKELLAKQGYYWNLVRRQVCTLEDLSEFNLEMDQKPNAADAVEPENDKTDDAMSMALDAAMEDREETCDSQEEATVEALLAQAAAESTQEEAEPAEVHVEANELEEQAWRDVSRATGLTASSAADPAVQR